ncbi:MAG: radical SAM/Cys-rich domain protein [Candidatus Binatia bacterium]|nr:MAG: radical SAM/Cys-rich domain protein [Candidatus Binatia bacterium]
METQSQAAPGIPVVPRFDSVLREHGLGPLRRARVRTLQVNVGKLCNQACHHCHVDAGPRRTEVMSRPVAERVVELLGADRGVETLDVTGGAPELNPNFPFLVEEARKLGRRVIDRCNLTVLFEPGMEWLPEFFVRHQVELVCSLPCYTAENVDRQRGHGVFDRSIAALRLLNRMGYGLEGSPLALDLVYNPLGAFLPPPQKELEARYREELRRLFGIEFRRLLTITNMPIRRFAQQLHRWGRYDEYMGLLVNHFNPVTVEGLMCRTLVSVDWEGRLYDCDFNQMLELPLAFRGRPVTVWDVDDFSEFEGRLVTVAEHCFGCTAGAGSSCGGALA